MGLTKSILFTMTLCVTFNVFAVSKWKKAPEYFTPIQLRVDKSIPSSEIEDGCFYMLVDNQVNLKTKESYYHYAYKVTSRNGVQNNSEIQINYNPAYQKLYLNSIKVYRNDKFIDYSQKVKVKELQREEDLENHIYSETLTVYLIMEDIRPGDIIEYSYTREGDNPVFEDFYYNSFGYQMSYMLLDFNLKIIKPEELKLFIKNHNTNLEPLRKKTSLGEELIWKMQDIPGVKAEDLAPSWHSEYADIEISSAEEWKQIRDWGRRVFNNTEVLSGQLKAVCHNIKEKNSSDAEKAVAALRYVQKNIRYLGMEIGENSHRPNSPNKVFKQAFGDCKDKSLLLVKMLQEMGIKAYPALVSTSLKEHLREYLPAPTLFNHTVVKAEIENQVYWFDPTISNQEGDIDHNYFAPYGVALVLDNRADRFPDLDPVNTKQESHIDINERITVSDMKGNATLYVITTYSGSDADDIRYTFATNSKKQIQESYLNFYKNVYLKIDTSGSLSVTDDITKNKVVVYENYNIKDFWKSEGTVIKAEVSAYDIYNKINQYQNKYSNRKSPLFLEYPLHLSHAISISLPQEWAVKTSDEHIDNDFFTFLYHTGYSNQTIKLNYDYITKKDFVPAENSQDFIADIQKINNQMSFQISYDQSASKAMNTTSIPMVLLFLAITGMTCFIIYRIYTKHKQINPDEILFHERIGGWVLLPVLGLILTPVLALFRLFQYKMFSDTIWHMITGFQSPLYSIVLIFELVSQVLYMVLPIALLIIAFRYDKRFPKLMIWYYILNITVIMIDMILTSNVPEIAQASDNRELIRSLVVASIWIPFFYYSERCKRTFIS